MFAGSFGVSRSAVTRYLDLLTSTFVVRQLQPWHENIGKRQVKAPKIYLADSGLLHALLNISTVTELEAHPKLGASWEGFLLHQVIQQLEARSEECFFWATHQGTELDLLIVRGKRRLGFEFKRTEAPGITKSMKIALEDLKLTHLDVVHAGLQTFDLQKRIRALSAYDLTTKLRALP